MNSKKIEIFTITGRSNSPCATISGLKYMNLGYYEASSESFFSPSSFGNFISPNYGDINGRPGANFWGYGIGNKAGLLEVSILTEDNLSGISYGDCCGSDGAPPGGGSPPGGGPPGGGSPPGSGIDCTNWSRGGGSSSTRAKFSITSELMSSASDNCDPGSNGGPDGALGGGGVGGGSQGDVHYFTSTYRKAGKKGLVFRDENLFDTIGTSHWVIEWLEINQEDEISAILSRRSSSNYFENTTINSAFYVYGNPIGVAKTLKDDFATMKGLSMTTQNNLIIQTGNSAPPIKYIGGMFVEFFRQIIRDSGPFGPDDTHIGRNKSFVSGDLFRLVSPNLEDLSPVTVNGQRISANESTLIPALKQYVNNLTGNSHLLNEMGKISPFLTLEEIKSDKTLISGLSLVSAAPEDPSDSPYGYYPQLMSSSQSEAIIRSYNQMVIDRQFDFSPIESINEDGDTVPVVPSKDITDVWAGARSNAISRELSPKVFECRPCVEANFQPTDNDCSQPDGKFKAAFKIESENIPGGVQQGPSNDCRCCGNLREDYYWNDAAFCGREESLCLPLAVIQNGAIIGYENYGYDHRVVPFFANENDDMGDIDEDIKIYEFPYVVNGKLVTGKFHCLDRFYNPNSEKFSKAKEFYPLMVNISGSITGMKIMCNNAFEPNYSNFPVQDLVYY